MMTDYAKATFAALYGEDDGLADPDWRTNWPPTELTPDEGQTGSSDVGTSSTTLIAANAYASLTLLALQNMDPVTGNPVSVSWTDSGANANTQIVPPGRMLVVCDVDGTVAVTAQATTSAVKVRLVAMGT